MRCISVIVLALGAQALKQESLSADPAFKLAAESVSELNENAQEISQEKETSDTGENWQFGMAAEELMTRMAVMPDLQPSDFKEKSSRSMWRTSAHQFGYYGAVALFGVLIAAIYSNRGIWQSIAVAAYVICLTLMSVSIRNVYVNFSFNYPQWLVVSHQFFTAVTGMCILKAREATGGKKIEFPTAATMMQGLGPVAGLFAFSLGLSNLGLLYANTHFYEMMNTTQIFAVVGISIILGRPFNMRFTLPITMCTLGLAAVAFGEMKFNLLGAVFVVGGVIVRAAKVQLQSMLMAPNQMTQQFDAVELMTWTGVLAFIIMLVWSMFSEGSAPWEDILDLGVLLAVGATCVCAVVLNFCALSVMKDLGPVAQQLVSQMKGVLACIGGWAAFQETITMQQMLGYAIVIFGIVWYNHTDLQIRTQLREDAAKALQKERGDA